MKGIFILYFGLGKPKISNEMLWEFLFLGNQNIIGRRILDFLSVFSFGFFLGFSPYFSAALKEGNRTKKRKCCGWINVLVEALIIFVLENQDNSLWDLVSLLEGNPVVLPFIFGNWQNNSGISWYMLYQVIHFSIAILFKWALFCSHCLTSYNKCRQLESSHFFV